MLISQGSQDGILTGCHPEQDIRVSPGSVSGIVRVPTTKSADRHKQTDRENGHKQRYFHRFSMLSETASEPHKAMSMVILRYKFHKQTG